MRLFILGNGFDRAHELPTSYEHFRNYLMKTYKIDLENMPYIPRKIKEVDGSGVFDIDQVATFIIYLISKAEGDMGYWSNIEKSLGELDYTEFFEKLPEVGYEEELINNEHLSEDLYDIVLYVQQFFDEWVRTINVAEAKVKKNFSEIMREDDLFFTFNYTETLEYVYGINKERICHIHGQKNQDIMFGHGNNEKYYREKFLEYLGAEETMSLLHCFLSKEVSNNCRNHCDFFEKMEEISEVFVIGFSFGDVDDEYIDEICYKISNSAIWHFNNFNKENVPLYVRKIKKFGSHGNYDIIELT